MKILMENLEPIKHVDVCIKPLTVFIGNNNLGKSRTLYTINGLLDDFGYVHFLEYYLSEDNNNIHYADIDNIYEEILKTGKVKVDIIDFFNKNFGTYLKDLSSIAPLWMSTFFGSKSYSFSNFSIDYDLSDNYECIKSRLTQFGFDHPPLANQIKVMKEKNDDFVYFYSISEISSINQLPKRAIIYYIFDHTFKLFHKAIYPRMFFLPSERTGLTFILDKIERKIESKRKKTKISSSNDDALPLPYPLNNFFGLLLAGTEVASTEKRDEKSKKDTSISKYIELANILNSKLETNIDFSTPEPESGRQIISKNNEVTLDIPVTSSMIKGLASLIIILKYFSEKNQLIIIDEPEMNLHPQAQIILIEFLAILVNNGLNIHITTHSSYIVDHLENLMKGYNNKCFDQVEKLYLKKSESLISSEKVAIYQFVEKEVKNILSEDGSIDWASFSTESNYLSEINYYFS
jgi:hypothetical protein